MTTDLAILNGRVGALMAELEQAPDEYREAVQTELDEAQEALAAAPRADYYVYTLFREDGTPFYIGKGAGDRWNHHERQARGRKRGIRRLSIIRRMQASGIEVPKVKIHEELTEVVAHEYEIALIKAIGRFPNGPLVNATDGGEGVSGLVFSSASRAKLAAAHRGKKLSPEHCAKLTAALRSPDVRAKMAVAGKAPGNLARLVAIHRGRKQSIEEIAKRAARLRGRTHRAETIAKMSASKFGHEVSPETRAKLTAANLGKKHSPETRTKMAAAHRGKTRSPEHCAKLAEAGRSPENRARLIVLQSSEARAVKAAAAMRSPETRAKLAAAGRGREVSPETRAKIAAAVIAALRSSPEYRAKLVAAAQAREAAKRNARIERLAA